MKKNQAARLAANEKQRELRESTTRGLDERLLASEKRRLNRQIAEGERELSRLEREAERQEAIQEANERVPPLTRACKAAGVPVFSPHDLRHRRATLWHLSGVPAAEAAAWLGHSPQEHLKTYAHVALVDRSEVEYVELLGCDRVMHTPMHTPIAGQV